MENVHSMLLRGKNECRQNAEYNFISVRSINICIKCMKKYMLQYYKSIFFWVE